jgi:hypothetical protein
MKRTQSSLLLLALLLPGLSPGDVRADGGVIRLREAQGPFVVTIFTASEPVMNDPLDVSVLVQTQDSSDAILDATVNLTCTAPRVAVVEPGDRLCGHSEGAGLNAGPEPHPTSFAVRATRRQASNKLLYAAPVEFSTAGEWLLQASVKRGSDAVRVVCTIPVRPPPGRMTGLLPYLVLPPLVVALFAMNQRLRWMSTRRN